MTNRLYYGDNLEVLRDTSQFPDACVDLIYLDPPFNSNAGYNVLFKSASGAGADASIEAFDDTWTWGEASKNALLDIAGGTNRPLQVMMEAMRTGIGENPLMAYLAMMAGGWSSFTGCSRIRAASTSTATRPRATTSSWCWTRSARSSNSKFAQTVEGQKETRASHQKGAQGALL